MQKLKRVLNVRVANTEQMLELLRVLSELNTDIIADSRPGSVKIRIYGSKDEIRDVTRKIRTLTSAKT